MAGSSLSVASFHRLDSPGSQKPGSALGVATGGHPGLLGEDHPNARLTTKQVLQIRELYATGKFLQKDLAVRFNISRPSLRKIVRKQYWSHL
jgi:hypothetical protein